ncbi:putative oxoglutarate/iron-dependent dioxygenase, non-heme dioxygenase domain-containing protein [Rosa chinensis]|uniref:Putative oxoglutarate/iron-dependent dioxygenase, non-heme dioxygenase domain-containing protein n=1 Tax=Rosa chinensis TaxID=74649 RepID=A0A2P6Q8S4_ROSCH|nr:putative oxoglutarate/iron-dependent dioxygenase, non-heme dioxygenase domain-containing protein [Rosa chinensis]
MVDLGLSKVPEQYIQPPHERILKLNASSLNELRASDQSICSWVLPSCEPWRHGLPVELLESLKDAANNFFEQAPEKKAAYRKGVSPSPYVKYGTSFVPEKEKALGWKDYVSMVYSSDADALSHWPNECNTLKESMHMVKKIVKTLIEKLGVTLEDSKLDGLVGLKMVNMVYPKKIKMVSMNFYPTCPNPELTVGVGRHSDMGTLTVLLQDGIGGLYVKVEEDMNAGKKGEWIEIPPIPGALILGNGRYKSAEYRVRTTNAQSRVSVPIFTIPNPTEIIGPLPEVVARDGVARYSDMVFGDYMNNFFGNAHEGKKSHDYAQINN